jgi:hypothetical protein
MRAAQPDLTFGQGNLPALKPVILPKRDQDPMCFGLWRETKRGISLYAVAPSLFSILY